MPPLPLLVFCVGIGSLGAEIAAVRLLSPYFGASTIVWANTIGVVLVALSIGYWLGGKLADRHPHKRGLCLLALTAAALLAVVPFAADPFLHLAVGALDSVSAGAFVGSLIGVLALLAVPILLLGAVSPWALRLAVQSVESAGEVAGRLYALSTAGSLVGTLLSALVLIPLVGTRRTFLIFAFVIAVVAASGLVSQRRWIAVPVAIAALAAIPVGTLKAETDDGRVIHEADTEYQYARVVQRDDGTRILELNEGQAQHSRIEPGTVLTGGYWDGMLVLPFTRRTDPPRRMAILGNAAGTTARAYGHFFPRTRIDGVELDSELTEIGRRYFDLHNPRLTMHHEDARPFLRRTDARYDVIEIDAYRQPYVPFYLTTKEFFATVRDRLTDDGVVIVNVGEPEGQDKLEKVVTAGVRSALPYALRDPIASTNTLVVGAKRPVSSQRLLEALPSLPRALRPIAAQSAAESGPPKTGGTLYTDDKAPVEWLIDKSILDYAEGASLRSEERSEMLSYANGVSDTPLLGQTIGQDLEDTVARHGEREALVCPHQDVRMTYAELDAAVDELARGLMAAGLEKGDRLALWSPNRFEWTLTQYATAKAGVILVNVNPAYRSSELEYVLRQSGARMLISARSHKTSDYAAMIEEVRGGLDGLERVVLLDGDDWEQLLAGSGAVGEDDLRARMGELAADDPINIQYTSGTTGFPKGATLSHHNILNNGFFVGEGCGYTEADRVCIPVPFYHCFGMVMGNLACTSHGACMVVPAEAFDPAASLRAVQDERCTSLYGVPTMFIAELALEDFDSYDLSSLRTGIMAGSPCPVEVMRQVIDRMHMDEVAIAYGMTETSPVSTQTGADDDVEHRTGTVGRVGPHLEVKVVDPDTGRPVERGESGELCTRGYSVMLGYWEEPEKTAEAIDAARWMHTGDLATMDEDGYLNIVGRSKDVIIRGGENVYPREIEEFLYTHPDVGDVQVVGVPDERYGEAVMAYVQFKDGAAPDTDALRDHCREKIAHYKVPAYIEATTEFPMTVTGKVQKYKLREKAIEELGLAEAQTA